MNNFKFTSPRCQYLSLPCVIITYLWKKNASSAKVFLKLYQTCKMFYSKQPILIFNESVNYNSDGKITVNNKQEILKNKVVKYWFNDSLKFVNCSLNNFKNIYRCTVKTMILLDSIFVFEDIKILGEGNKLKKLSFINSSIVYDNSKNNVPIDIILELFSTMTTFYYNNKLEKYEAKTLNSLKNIKRTQKFAHISIQTSRFITDVSAICQFIENNSNSSTTISLHVNAIHFDDLKAWKQKWQEKCLDKNRKILLLRL